MAVNEITQAPGPSAVVFTAGQLNHRLPSRQGGFGDHEINTEETAALRPFRDRDTGNPGTA